MALSIDKRGLATEAERGKGLQRGWEAARCTGYNSGLGRAGCEIGATRSTMEAPTVETRTRGLFEATLAAPMGVWRPGRPRVLQPETAARQA